MPERAEYDVCPFCWADLRSSEIPKDSLLKGYYGEWKEGDGPRWFSRLCGIELPYDHPDHYDGVSAWTCPDCGAVWSRWTNELLPVGWPA